MVFCFRAPLRERNPMCLVWCQMQFSCDQILFIRAKIHEYMCHITTYSCLGSTVWTTVVD